MKHYYGTTKFNPDKYNTGRGGEIIHGQNSATNILYVEFDILDNTSNFCKAFILGSKIGDGVSMNCDIGNTHINCVYLY